MLRSTCSLRATASAVGGSGGLLHASRTLLGRNLPGERRHEDRSRPVITRTRSWRGLMQVRHDDTKHDYKVVAKHFFIYSPLRVGSMFLLCLTVGYCYLGHDGFMYHLFGYESEAAVEHRAMKPAYGIGELLLSDRKANRGFRQLEEDRYEDPKFNLYVTPAEAEPTTIKV